MSASTTFGGDSVQPPPPRASEARAALEQPGLPLPWARAAAELPWQPGRPALYACASVHWRLRAHPGLSGFWLGIGPVVGRFRLHLLR